jgi:hypothetical protein
MSLFGCWSEHRDLPLLISWIRLVSHFHQQYLSTSYGRQSYATEMMEVQSLEILEAQKQLPTIGLTLFKISIGMHLQLLLM